LEPHNPYFGPLDELHEDENVTVPKTFYTDSIEKNELYRDQILAEKNKDRYVKNEESIRDLVSKYWGLVSQVDKSMGAILDKVDELGLTENTIVVFTSDHGEMLGAHKLTGKSVMFEEAIKVPFILRVPQLGMKERIVEQNVSQIDIVPTILDLMGTKPDESLQGKSLVPYMKSMDFPEEDIFIQWNPSINHYDVSEEMAHIGDPDALEKSLNGSARTVVTPDGWKLVLTDHDNYLLFDLKNDPLETTNVFYKEENKQIIEKLTNKIRTWQIEMKDPLELNI
ncbi:MAG: sulfatase, partial [Bacteroidota bacterium]